MSDESYDEERQAFINKFNSFLENLKAEEKAQEKEIVNDVAKNVISLVNDGSVYVHAGHLEEIIQEAVASMTETVETFTNGSDDLPPQVVGYTVGVSEVVRVIYLIIRGLTIKHSDEIELPMDDLVDEIEGFMNGDDK